MKIKDLKESLVLNALDFLQKAIDYFPDNPKHSIINFYSAVELFLKARLIDEHWTLVVSKDPDHGKFNTGDFISVTFEEACSRLSKIVQSPISDPARSSFDIVRKHRNRMVHFFHSSSDDEISSIASQQLIAWYELHKLLTTQWSSNFFKYSKHFTRIESNLKRHRDYLQIKFRDIKTKISEKKKSGTKFQKCRSCKFLAAELREGSYGLREANCLLCGLTDAWLPIKCPSCESPEKLFDGGTFKCKKCEEVTSDGDLIDYLNEEEISIDNYTDARTPANCSFCDGYHTVIEHGGGYICTTCLTPSSSVSACEWCSEFNNGDMEHSYVKGCNMCDGRSGWDAD